MKVVTRPKPNAIKNCWFDSTLLNPNGLKMNRKRNINKPKRRIETNLPLDGSTTLNGLLNMFVIANYLQTNLYILKEKGKRKKGRVAAN